MYTVTAKDASTAMDEVVAKLGSDAMIVSTRRVENGVEITATSDVLDLSNRIGKSSSTKNKQIEQRELSEARPISNISSVSSKMTEEDLDTVSARQRLMEEIEALLDKHGATKDKSLNSFLDRYEYLFEAPNRFTNDFCSRKYQRDDFIEEFVSDLVSEDAITLEDISQLFVIGNNGVGKSTFSSKFCNKVRNKSGDAEVHLIEANNKGYSSSTLLSVSAKMMQQKYSSTLIPNDNIAGLTITEMNIAQFVQSMDAKPDDKNTDILLTVTAGMNYSALCKILRSLERYHPKIVFTKLDEQDLSVEELIAIYNFGLKVIFLSADEKLSDGLCYVTQDILTCFLRDRITEN